VYSVINKKGDCIAECLRMKDAIAIAKKKPKRSVWHSGGGCVYPVAAFNVRWYNKKKD